MASGKLGKALLAANEWTLLYTVPQGKESTFNISAVNVGADTGTLTIAISDMPGEPVAADVIEYSLKLGPTDVLERTGIVAGANETVYAYADTDSIAIRVHGFENNA